MFRGCRPHTQLVCSAKFHRRILRTTSSRRGKPIPPVPPSARRPLQRGHTKGKSLQSSPQHPGHSITRPQAGHRAGKLGHIETRGWCRFAGGVASWVCWSISTSPWARQRGQAVLARAADDSKTSTNMQINRCARSATLVLQPQIALGRASYGVSKGIPGHPVCR